MRPEANHCGIRWTQTEDAFAFKVDGNAAAEDARNGSGECTKDFITIPNGHNGSNQCAVLMGLVAVNVPTIGKVFLKWRSGLLSSK